VDVTIFDRITVLDERSFELIFKEFYPPLVMFANKFTKDSDASADIVHQVFIKFWEKREEMEPDQRLKSYLFTSVHNRCLNYLRDRKKFVQSDLPADYAALNQYVEDPLRMEEEELRSQIDAAIEALPEKTREVFILSRFEDLKYKEIAERLDISVKTVENQMGRALRMLREKLGDYLVILIMIFFER
jgi:RNA polymerase sigma-70 factor (ECF subfamily)